jgi:hypothetical protein
MQPKNRRCQGEVIAVRHNFWNPISSGKSPSKIEDMPGSGMKDVRRS